MNRWKTLQLLLWKLIYLRKYYKVWSIIEICCPILLIYVLVKVCHNITGYEVEPVQETIENATTQKEFLWKVKRNYDAILYTPSNYDTNKIMNTVATLCDGIQIRPIVNETDLNIVVTGETIKYVGVVFMNTETQYEYIIRDRNVWHTDQLFIELESSVDGPYLDDPYFTLGFSGLQIALDYSFLKMKLLSTTEYEKIVTQPFPYPAYLKKSPWRSFVPLFMGITIIFTSVTLCFSSFIFIIGEKENGLREFMKNSGIDESILWLSWMLNAIINQLIVCTFVTFILRHSFYEPDSAAIQYVSTSLIWFCIMLYYIANTSFCFIFCAAFHSVSVAVTSHLIVVMVCAYLAFKVHQWHKTVFVHLSCLIPAAALVQGFLRISYYELLNQPLTWSSIFSNEMNAADASLGFTFLMLIFDTLVNCGVILCVSFLSPDEFGTRKSLRFFLEERNVLQKPFQKSQILRGPSAESRYDPNFFEYVFTNNEAIFSIKDLQKGLGLQYPVKDFSLTIHKGELLVLLGHKGAGKTTTLKMISGSVEPTGGQILYKETADLYKNIGEVRKHMGICLEENRLFQYLSVLNQLIFFGMLKNLKSEEAEEEAKSYLSYLGMLGRAHVLTSSLSKMLKRKLALQVAFMGKAEILIMDEPTKGIDSQTRNKIWDLFVEMRKTRTVILSTENIDEAEALGSRIGIINHGILTCCGSLKFLNKAFGTGYLLTIKTDDKPSIRMKDSTDVIVSLVMRITPEAKLRQRKLKRVLQFNLPFSSIDKFPILFKILEGRKSALLISSIHVTSTTMNEIYARIDDEIWPYPSSKPPEEKKNTKKEKDIVLKSKLTSEGRLDYLRIPRPPPVTKLEGYNLVIQQHFALLAKKQLYAKRNWTVIFKRVVVPSLLLVVLIYGTTKYEQSEPPLTLSVDTYPVEYHFILKHNISFPDYSDAYTYYLNERGRRPYIPEGTEIISALLNYAHHNLKVYRRDAVTAVDFNRHTKLLKLLYNKWFYHSLPTSINLFSNIYFQVQAQNDSMPIITINHPIKHINVTKLQDRFLTNVIEQPPIITVWYILLAFITVDLLQYFAWMANIERVSGFKHIQLISNVSPVTYWSSTFVHDLVFAWIIIFLRMLVCKQFDYYGFFIFGSAQMAMITLLITLFFMSGLIFIYVIVVIIKVDNIPPFYFFIVNIWGTVITFVYYTFQTSVGFFKVRIDVKIILTLVKYFCLLIPPLNFSLAFEKFLMNWRVNNLVSAYQHYNLVQPIEADSDIKTDGSVKGFGYMEFASVENPNGLLEEVLFLIMDFFLYTFVLYCLETDFIKILRARFQFGAGATSDSAYSIEIAPKTRAPLVDDVQAERRAVESDKNKGAYTLLVYDLTRIFEIYFRLPVAAIVDLSFVASAGECFGLLGSAKSGKTTSLRMLVGDLKPTNGDARIKGFWLSDKRSKYLFQTGYCPENDRCFSENLTGRELLMLISSLKGVPKRNSKQTVKKWVQSLELENDENELYGKYGIESRKKICVAASLIGDPSVVFLDEPTRGVDPISKRKLQEVIAKTKTEGKVVVISSSSMDECEQLCDRLTIVVRGDMKFVGTINLLEKKFGEGLSLKIQTYHIMERENDGTREDQIEILKVDVPKKFTPDSCTFKEEDKNTLLFHISEKLPWSDLFTKLAELKKSYMIISEYTVSEISLEQIYMSFHKEDYEFVF